MNQTEDDFIYDAMMTITEWLNNKTKKLIPFHWQNIQRRSIYTKQQNGSKYQSRWILMDTESIALEGNIIWKNGSNLLMQIRRKQSVKVYLVFMEHRLEKVLKMCNISMIQSD
jgi:hypothetical protein